MPDTLQKTTVDAAVSEARPSANFGQAAFLPLSAASGDQWQAFVYFALPFNPGGDPDLTVFSATLTLSLAGSWAGTNGITATRITEKWGENSLRWSNRPAVDGTNSAGATVTGGVNGDTVDLDLTAMLGDVAAGAPFFGVRLVTDATSIRSLFAAENPNQTMRALLDIDWSRTPLAPVNLSPSGDLSVSVGAPVLDWQFDSNDHSAERHQAYSQVEMSTTSDFASLTYNSGKVANTLSSWDLSADGTFTAMADGDELWWRVRVWDDRGQSSDFSDAVQFQRTTKGTLAITNPTTTIDELTPPVEFNLSGRTQEAVKIALYQLDGVNLIEKWTYGKTVTADESIEIPHGIIKSGEGYRVGVAVWDTIDRVATQGDPTFVWETQDFSYARGGFTLDPVFNLTAVQGLGPGVLLTWHRAVAPVYFCLKVNGVEVMDRINPDDVHVSGQTYQMTYYGAVSGDNNLYEVEAVENPFGHLVHSEGNDTDRLTLKVTAKWLIDDDLTDGSALEIKMREQANLTLSKSATVYTTVGGQRPVERIDALRGYEGTISGKVEGVAAKEKLEQMVANAKPLRFIQAKMNIPVEIQGEPDIAPDSETVGADLWVVSVPISQVGEFLTAPGVG